MKILNKFLNCESGATAIEYSLIVTFVFLVILGAVTSFADNSTTKLIEASETIVAATN